MHELMKHMNGKKKFRYQLSSVVKYSKKKINGKFYDEKNYFIIF